MPGPWSDTRQGVAFEQTTEWYESDLEENTAYEVDVAFNEDFSDAVRHTFRTQRTDRSVELRSVTINPEGDVAAVFDSIDYSRETDGAGSGVYNHILSLVLDQPRRAAVSAIAVSSQARVVVDPPNLQLAAASFPQFTVTVTNGGNTRTYRFTITPTVPDLLEFDNAGALSDIASDGATMWGAVRTQGIQAYDFFTKQKLGDVVALRGLTRIAYDFTNETIWYTTETSAAIEIDPSSNYAATGRRITFPSTIRALSWHGDRLYAKQRSNTSTWFIGNTLTTARAGSVDLDVQRFGNNAEMWRNDDNYFMYNNGAVQGERFRIFNVDRTRNTALEARFGGGDLEEWLVNAPATFWGNDTHLFVQGRNVIRAYDLITGLRQITIGANFRGAGDLQLRRGGVVNPRDLWGNTSTMWVLNNNLENAEFTGDRTKLVAFNRADGTHNERLTFDIQDVIRAGQGICGNSTHMWALGDGWLRCWTHGGVRTPGLDLAVAEGAQSCFYDGVHWWADDVAYNAAGGVVTPRPRLLPNYASFRDQEVSGLDINAAALDNFTLRFGRYRIPDTTPRFRCTAQISVRGDIRRSSLVVTRNPAAVFGARFDESIRIVGSGLLTYTETFTSVDDATDTTTTQETLGLSGGYSLDGIPVFYDSYNRSTGFGSSISVSHSITGQVTRAVTCERIPSGEVARDWASSSLDLRRRAAFFGTTGLFRDGNDVWVIEPNLPVAAKFTIQSDGSIARNLS